MILDLKDPKRMADYCSAASVSSWAAKSSVGPVRRAFRYMVAMRILRPLIKRDYRLRAAGFRPDRWYWADTLACSWGFVGVANWEAP